MWLLSLSSAGKDGTGDWLAVLPTEGGDNLGYTGEPWVHGSPIQALHIRGNTQQSRCTPLVWAPWERSRYGGDNNYPVVFEGVALGKHVILDPEEIPLRCRSQVARYETLFTTPFDLPLSAIEIPTGYLTADFSKYIFYDAENNRAETVTLGTGQGTSRYGIIGGAILATPNGDYAMGVYGSPHSGPGSVLYFSILNFGGAGTHKWRAAWGDHSSSMVLRRGSTWFKTYIITGTLSDVQDIMRTLFQHGVR